MQATVERAWIGMGGAYQDAVASAYPLGNGYRWHLPWLSRFNAPDGFSPFGVGGANPYAYCGDEPINRIDPSGHAPLGELQALEDAPAHMQLAQANRESASLAASRASRAPAAPFAGRRVRTAPSIDDGRDNVIREDEAGAASARIAYPGISSCLTVTRFSDQGMRGVHIPASSGTTTAHIDNMLAALNAGRDDTFLVAGAIELFKKHVGSAEFNTRRKISSRLKALAPDAEVRFFDTATVAQETHIYIDRRPGRDYVLSVLPATDANRGPDSVILGHAHEAMSIAPAQLARVAEDPGAQLLATLRLLPFAPMSNL